MVYLFKGKNMTNAIKSIYRDFLKYNCRLKIRNGLKVLENSSNILGGWPIEFSTLDEDIFYKKYGIFEEEK